VSAASLERPPPGGGPANGVVSPLRYPPWPEMVAYLREKLAEAERGDLRALFVVCEHSGGQTGSQAFTGTNAWPSKLLGEVELLAHGLRERERERRGASCETT
jgi:hypothetical protein